MSASEIDRCFATVNLDDDDDDNDDDDAQVIEVMDDIPTGTIRKTT